MLETLFAWARGGTGLWWITGAAAVVIAGYVGYTQVALANRATKIAELTAEAAEARRVAKSNEDALAEAQKRHTAALAAVLAERAAADKRAQRGAQTLRKVSDAKDRDMAVGPALDAALDGLLGGPAPAH